MGCLSFRRVELRKRTYRGMTPLAALIDRAIRVRRRAANAGRIDVVRDDEHEEQARSLTPARTINLRVEEVDQRFQAVKK